MMKRNSESEVVRRSDGVSTSAKDYRTFPFPHFSKPMEVAVLGVDGEKNALEKPPSPKYYAPPSSLRGLNFDLNQGFENKETRDESAGLKALLQWIARTSEGKPLKSLGTDFLSWRGLLTRLASTPFENRDGWKMGIIRFGDVYFLREFETESKREQRLNMSERDRRMTYWGRKFEQYIISDILGGDPDPGQELSSEDYTSIVRTKLDRHKLMFAGEIDCKDPETGKYLEVKTSRIFTHPRQESNFHKFKTLKWWIQSFLIGIETIICGFRDDEGIVRELRSFDLRSLAKDHRAGWSASVCMNFLTRLMEMIEEGVMDNNPRRVFLMEWHPGQGTVTLVESSDSSHQFLPDWFIDMFL